MNDPFYTQNEKNVRKQVETEFEKDDSDGETDYCDIDPELPGQNFYVVSFAEPKRDHLEMFESFAFTHFLTHVDQETFVDILSDPDNVAREYNLYKQTHKVALELAFKEKHPGVWLERAFKMRGVFKTEKAAQERAKKLGAVDKDFTMFVTQVGAWSPYNPNPIWCENYTTDNKELNAIIKGHKVEMEKARRAVIIRKELAEKEAARNNEKIKAENKKLLADPEAARKFEEDLKADPTLSLIKSHTLTEDEEREEQEKIKKEELIVVDI